MRNSTTAIIEASYIIRVYAIPVIILVGSCLNLFSFFVMKRIGSTTSFFMSILGLVDTCVLLTGGVNIWLQAFYQWTLLMSSNLACKALTFLIYTLLDFSVGIIVIMTLQKVLAVSSPIKSRKFKLSKTKCYYIVALTFLFYSFINMHFIFTHSLVDFKQSLNESFIKFKEENKNETFDDIEFEELYSNISSSSYQYMCTYTQWSSFYENYWPFIDASIYSFLPFLFLAIFNSLIIYSLTKAKMNRNELTPHQSIENQKISVSKSNDKLKRGSSLSTVIHFDIIRSGSASSVEMKEISRRREVNNYETENSANTNSQRFKYGSSLKVSENSENSKLRRRKSIFLRTSSQNQESKENEYLEFKILEKSKIKKRHSADEESRFLPNASNKNELKSKRNRMKREDCIDFSEENSNQNSIKRSKVRRLHSFEDLSDIIIKVNKCESKDSDHNNDLKSSCFENEKSCNESQVKDPTKNSKRNIFILKRNMKNNCIKYIDKRLTITLFLINVSFMIMTMPAVILQIIFSKNNIIYLDMIKILQSNESIENDRISREEDNLYYYNLLKAISELLQYLNHSTNFILYCLSGKTFRDEAKDFILSIYENSSCFRKK